MAEAPADLPVLCGDCAYREALPESVTWTAEGNVLDAVCEKCQARRDGASGVQAPGTILVQGVARAFLKGYHNRDVV